MDRRRIGVGVVAVLGAALLGLSVHHTLGERAEQYDTEVPSARVAPPPPPIAMQGLSGMDWDLVQAYEPIDGEALVSVTWGERRYVVRLRADGSMRWRTEMVEGLEAGPLIGTDDGGAVLLAHDWIPGSRSGVSVVRVGGEGDGRWRARIGRAAVARAMAVTASGHIIVAGEAYDEVDCDTHRAPPGSFLARLDARGRCEWVQPMRIGPADEGRITDVAVQADSIFVSGWCAAECGLSGQEGDLGFLLRVDVLGEVAWVHRTPLSVNAVCATEAGPWTALVGEVEVLTLSDGRERPVSGLRALALVAPDGSAPTQVIETNGPLTAFPRLDCDDTTARLLITATGPARIGETELPADVALVAARLGPRGLMHAAVVVDGADFAPPAFDPAGRLSLITSRLDEISAFSGEDAVRVEPSVEAAWLRWREPFGEPDR